MSLHPIAATVVVVLCLSGTLAAEAPLKLADIASPAALIAEATDRAEEIGKGLESEAIYNEQLKTLRPAASLVGVIGQALAEHPEESKLKAAGPSIRNAAIAVARAKTYADAVAAFPKLKSALQGEVDPAAAVEFDWAKLTKMHPIMEEMSGRGARFRRVLRRPKDPEADANMVAMIALAAVSTYADTHEVKNPADLPQWQAWSTELYTHMVQAAAAMRAKDVDKARDLFNLGMETCTKCHEKFQD